MNWSGWPYIGRNINGDLQSNILVTLRNIKSAKKNGITWGEMQDDIGKQLNLKPGSVRTIKRVMEALGIVKDGALNSCDTLDIEDILTQRGKELMRLYELEDGLRHNDDVKDSQMKKKINELIKLYYQLALSQVMISKEGIMLHPLRETLIALRRFESLDYFEWIIVNTCSKNDGDCQNNLEMEHFIAEYRANRLTITQEDVKAHRLSNSYYLSDFETAGFIKKRLDGRYVINREMAEEIETIVNSEVIQNGCFF